MTPEQDLIQRDKQHIWHPAAHIKETLYTPPLVVHKAKGSLLYTDQGPLIDAISSWWCKSLGHGHPQVLAALRAQLDSFEHVIAANTTHPKLVALGEKLAKLSKKQHVFFASDGSSAVEIALKLALQAMQIRDEGHRQECISLAHSYHGETLATLSVSDLGVYKKPYQGYGLRCHFIDNLPYVSSKNDPLWSNADLAWQTCLPKLEALKSKACAVIVEPLIQGSGGMLCYSADFLKRLAIWAKNNGIYLIADEIMTGLCRTGAWLASDHAAVEADLICVSKGLTSGALPLSCVLIDTNIYTLFKEAKDHHNAFLHSHTHSANALAVAAALATLEVMEAEDMNHQAQTLGKQLFDKFTELALLTKHLSNVRGLGAMVAADLKPIEGQHVGRLLAQEAIKRGALLRPIGNTLYWLPPLNTDTDTIDKLTEITLHSINTVYG